MSRAASRGASSGAFGCGGSARANWQQRADVVVIGTGVAGLAAGLAAHRKGARTVILSKADDTATFYAQGGIAVVLPFTDDTVESHVEDTLVAGAGLCDPEAVRSIVADGYQAVADLIADGARFDESSPGHWALTREGGHSGAASCTPEATPPERRSSVPWTTPRLPSTSDATTSLWRSCTTSQL